MPTQPNRATGAREPRAAIRQAVSLAPNDNLHHHDDNEAPYELAAAPPWRTWLDDQASWLTSSVLHAVAILALALVPILSPDRPVVSAVESSFVPPEPPIEPKLDPGLKFGEPVLTDQPPDIPKPSNADPLEQVNLEIEAEHEPPREIVCFDDFPRPDPDAPLKKPWSTRSRRGGRDGDGRSNWDGNGHPPRGTPNTIAGPSDDSEAAVDAALAWLAVHQLADGSWSFDHRDGACNGRCKDHGQFKAAKNAATGLALLTFLGAGETHMQGRHQDVVDNGLRFLLATQKLDGKKGSWHEAVGNSGNYSHCIATLAVSEALAMSDLPARPPAKSLSEMTEEERRQWRESREREKRRGKTSVTKERLAAAAQAGIDYLVAAQHSAGGWRYNPGQEGDTSVVGWALMAAKSAYQGKVRVDKRSVIAASTFLDSVQDGDYGSIYHYMADKNRPQDALKATTAIGLLCRMYLGWDRQHPGMVEGVAQLARWQPSTGAPTNMYYNYYATQVMHHYGGAPWREWNRVLREHLVKTQSKAGHELGSWHFTGDHGTSAGGRLYNTTLAAMTLEVYYRYLPIYRDASDEDDLQKP